MKDESKKNKENEIKKENRKPNKKIKIAIISILAIILIVCAIYLIIHFYNANKNKNLYNNLQKEINNIEIEITKAENNAYIEKVKELKAENSDIKGWIRIENTNINYPLLQTTNNDYYLNHNYKKEKSSYGSIVINSKSNIKNENANVIIYGHDMRDSQMFTDLLKYVDKSYYDEHKIIKIATEEHESEYEIAYTFKSRVFYQDEKNVFRYYQYYDFENENKFNEYINNCKKIQLYDTGVQPTYGQQLITLITCEYSQENGRMVVVARKIK